MAARFKTFTAGSVLTASEVNTYLAKQAVINCDSSADYPSAPVVGMTVYDLDKDALLVYAGATSGWRPPWNMPWGLVVTDSPADFTFSSTKATTPTFTWTAVANRVYRTTLSATLENDTVTGVVVSTGIETSAGVNVSTLLRWTPTAQASLFRSTGATFASNLSGSISWRVWAQSSASATNQTLSTVRVTVEDIGPAGAPS